MQRLIKINTRYEIYNHLTVYHFYIKTQIHNEAMTEKSTLVNKYSNLNHLELCE